MRRIKDSLRLRFENGMSQRQVGHVVGLGRSTMSEYWRRFDQAGVGWADASRMSDVELERLLFPFAVGVKIPARLGDLDFEYLHAELRRPGVTMQLLWEEHLKEHPQGYRYSQFCRHYHAWAQKLKVYMRQIHKGGEKVYVDYSGKKPCIVNPETGEIREVELFVMAWAVSHFIYSEAQESQAFYNFAMGHARGFDYFGGVPKFTVPDNPKAAVSKACIYDPEVNRGYTELSEHYGFGVLPARPCKPRDKAKVEVAVQIVQRWILAKIRNRVFHSLAELNMAIRELLEDLNNRPLKRLKRSRRELFLEWDKPYALPLPQTPYVYSEWGDHGMGLDYHVEVDKHYYSFPASFYRKERRVATRLTETVVEIYYGTKRIATHIRSHKLYGYTTDKSHMPQAHRSLLDETPGRLIAWAERIGVNTGELIKKLILSKTHPEQAVRPALGILRLGQKAEPGRMESVSKFAREHNLSRVSQIKEVLVKQLDKLGRPSESKGTVQNTENVRGQEYYQQSFDLDHPAQEEEKRGCPDMAQPEIPASRGVPEGRFTPPVAQNA